VVAPEQLSRPPRPPRAPPSSEPPWTASSSVTSAALWTASSPQRRSAPRKLLAELLRPRSILSSSPSKPPSCKVGGPRWSLRPEPASGPPGRTSQFHTRRALDGDGLRAAVPRPMQTPCGSAVLAPSAVKPHRLPAFRPADRLRASCSPNCSHPRKLQLHRGRQPSSNKAGWDAPETAAAKSRPPFLRRAHPIPVRRPLSISPTLGPRNVPWHSGPFPRPPARELPAPGSGGGGANAGRGFR
jgi:hypothetical protein